MGSIEKHPNALSFTLLNDIHEHIVANSNNYIWRQNDIWNEDIVAGSAPIMMTQLDKFEPRLREEIGRFIPEVRKMNLWVPFPMFFSMPQHAQIGWHEDYTPINVSIYLNEYWDKNWGGLFLYMEEENLKGFVPEFNTAVVAKGQIQHHVSMISTAAPVRRYSIQLFFAERDKEYVSHI